MARVKSKDTKPEKTVRSVLHRMGFRFRLHVSDLPGKPDIVLPKHKKVIFVNGCFWHGHSACRKGKLPKNNVDFWKEKIGKNKKRDKKVRIDLEKAGWGVLTLWECQTKNHSQLQKTLSSFLKSGQEET